MALDLKNIDLKDLNIRNVPEWPLAARMVIVLIVCLGVLYLAYMLDFSGYGGQIYSRFQQEQDLKGQVKGILDTEEDMKEVLAQFPQVLKLLGQWQGQLINGDDLPDLLNKILKLGEGNHLQFTQFAPGAKKPQDDYVIVPIKVVAHGSYSDIANFISQVANLPQLVGVGDFTLEKDSAASSPESTPSQVATAAATGITVGLTLEVYCLANKK